MALCSFLDCSYFHDRLGSDGIVRAARANPTLIVGIAAGLVLVLTTRYLTSPWRKLPPGPRGLPFIGNAHQLKEEKWLLFSAWRKVYGDMFYVNAAGQPIIVINKHSVAVDLLERRATKYIDRPPNIVGWEILTGGLIFAFGRYDELCRRMRRTAQEAMNKVVVRSLDEYMTSEALVLARNTLQDASSWDHNLHHASGSVMLSCLYGEHALDSDHDPRIDFMNEYIEHVTRALAPGAHWVEMMPWMRYIPSNLAAWKRSAEHWYNKADSEFLRMFKDVQDKIVNGKAKASFCTTLVEQADRYGLSTRENAWLAATMFSGGAHTSAALMNWWSLAMLAYPEAQKRAQRELDAVVGRSRLPSFADAPHLPYITATVKELLRWGPVAPLGLPHYSTENDIYDGYFIPRGSVVIANVWELNRDPDIYGADANHFNPSRYLDEKGQLRSDIPGAQDDGHFTYGAYTFCFITFIALTTSRLWACIGKQVANKSLFIEIATCLWAFSLANVEGQKLDVNAFRDQGTVVRPKPFNIGIQPRYPDVFALLTQECEIRGR
ncbi:cytochrome P450 [Peniophora sp. CONT]|nr:cytochrome P450 [Peniophora sp. CONT]